MPRFKLSPAKIGLGIFGILLAGLPHAPARAEIVLQGRCHMGQCTQVRFERKVLLEERGNERLYAIDTAARTTPMGEQPSGAFAPSRRSYMFCSLRRPAYIASSAVSSGFFSVGLNPGMYPGGAMHEAQMLYWTTCHNIVGPDFFSDEMRQRAIDLGYPLDLDRTERVTGDTVDDVLPW